ncbi:MAG: thiol peroxidase [Anaerolineae bacterium]|nr:thiol peroxidase [Anaerolineae bacterium]
MSTRPGMVVRGNEHHVQGDMLEVGSKAPDFALVANDMSIKTLTDYGDKVKILSVVPSLDTGPCSVQTHRFNQEAANLSDQIVILTISADLPFAQKRWCGAEGVDRVETLSTHRDMKFSDDYGVHDTDWRVNQRSLFVLDSDNVIRYAEYVPVISDEVNFEAALNTARGLVE